VGRHQERNEHRQIRGSDGIATTTGGDIDFGVVPRLDGAFRRNARLVEPNRTQSVTPRVKKSPLETY
jgi:hypothetical protein